MIWLYWGATHTLDDRPRFLHRAPEKCLEPRLRAKLGDSYLTADLSRSGVDVLTDFTQMVFSDASFDVVYCSNVLEHISEDRRAMSEINRVLRGSGVAYVQVPIRGEVTLEDPAILTPEDRARHYGQADHVRYYGRDIRERITASGFYVKELPMPGALRLTAKQLQTYNLNVREWLYVCQKTND